jgi:hypothetical protein
MNKPLPYIIQGNSVVVVVDNVPHTIKKSSHIAYTKVVDAIKAQNWDVVRETINPKKVLLSYGAGNISIKGDEVSYKGVVMHNALTKRLVSMYQDGFPIEPMVNFMDNLMQNPSASAVKELYGFLEKNNLPLTPDGHFLAYKKVREDYKDCHTGTIDNSVGKVVKMDRNMVDDERNNTCSTGLHFCSSDYLAHFGGERTMILKINPRDVVSIPSDYNDSKGRCCQYEVVGELGVDEKEDPDATFVKAVADDDRWAAPGL